MKMSFPQSVSGNPDVVPAKAGNYTKGIGFLFSQETLDSCFRRNDSYGSFMSGRTGVSSVRKGIFR